MAFTWTDGRGPRQLEAATDLWPVSPTSLAVTGAFYLPLVQWDLGHKKPSTRNPTLESQDSYRLAA